MKRPTAIELEFALIAALLALPAIVWLAGLIQD